MAEPEKDGPSLELPKLSLRRKRRPAPTPEPVVDRAPEPAPEPVPEPAPEPVVEQTRPLLVEEPAPVAPRAAEPARRPKPPKPPRPPKERGPGGMGAALVTGLVVGLGIVGLTWASLRSCESIQGTSSCGDAGYPMLGLILVLMVVVGWLLLRQLRVTDPGSTSFLGAGLAAVLCLLVLVDHLMDRSMVVVVPLLTAATFAAAHWVTRTFIEPPTD